ncbi:hypothetical protein C1645_828762 [Glomus cerebriforme]|uniref:Uncharacterized protein n=1 Tax=Glomus cerebriforme TaxID=658196 RepID=A0A397SS38_9GLOM|nr:hypothetical protein C1645_828762 [Glomus cerebriforme]
MGCLYNDIIVLLKENQNEGWNINQDQIANTFIKRLVDLLWYIDPHRDTLAARSLYLPCIFKELNLYQHNKYYNNFYHTGHHKKELLKREKLEQLANKYSQKICRIFAKIYYTIEGSLKIDDKYQELSDFLLDKNNYEFFNLEEYIPSNPMQKYRYIKNLQPKFPITIYWYHQGNYLENLPKYFTRQMRKNYSLIKKVTPAMLQTLYYDLTGDASATSNSICKEIEDQLQIMITLEDPSIIVDLRINNGFKEKEFDTFWNEMEAYFNENIPAVDDRRQGLTLYLPLAISILQARQLRKDHPDAHYCACLFQYLHEFAILYCNHTCFIAADDKHKVPIGEGVAISTGIHNTKSMVSTDAVLVASDHDFTKLSLTPSITFFIDIPESIEHSFYDGKQLVLHDIPFETKNPADEETIEEFFEIILSIDKTLKISDTTMDVLLKKKIFKNLYKHIVKSDIIVFRLKSAII